MTSQCLDGRVCDRVYDTGRDLLDAGIVEGERHAPRNGEGEADVGAGEQRRPGDGDAASRSPARLRSVSVHGSEMSRSSSGRPAHDDYEAVVGVHGEHVDATATAATTSRTSTTTG